MRRRALCVLLSCCLPLFGPPPQPQQPTKSLDNHKPAERLRVLLTSGKFREAAEYGDEASKASMSKGDIRSAIYFDYGTCQAWFNIKQYSRALESAVRGRDRAVSIKSWANASLADFGIAKVYTEMGNFTLALHYAREMLEFAVRGGAARTLEQRLLLGSILRRLGDLEEAKTQYRLALDESDRLSTDPVNGAIRVAAILDQLGELALSEGALADAEHHFVDAFRQRLLVGKADLGWSYNALSKLRCRQSRWQECIQLITSGIERLPSSFAPHYFLLRRAEARLQLGQTRAAFDDLQQATRVIRSMRLNLPFGDALQTSKEGEFQRVYGLSVEVAVALYEETRDQAYLRAAFLAAQENRAASLRTRLDADPAWREKLPPAYWEKLNELRSEEIRMLRKATSGSSPDSIRLRAELAAIESIARPEPVSLSQESLPQLQARLRSGDLLIAFHLGEPRSFRFVVSGAGISMKSLAARESLTRDVEAFRKHVEAGSPQHVESGLTLYEQLLADVPETPQAVWTIVPDETLFRLPFAAIACHRAPLRYLVERHALQLAPSASGAVPKKAGDRSSMLLVGDPISNRADDRISRVGDQPALQGRGDLEFPRLAGSAVEIERCARNWTLGSQESLTGTRITIDALREKLRARPMVLHFATHIFQPSSANSIASSPVITLGLSPFTGWTVLTDTQIGALESPTYVVMSGCGSGQGPLAPGTGLLGLTRAWLMAGSQAVVASLWPMLDDQGEFFESYYDSLQRSRELSSSRRSAQALANAQVNALKRPSGRGVERWAAYFSIGVL